MKNQIQAFSEKYYDCQKYIIKLTVTDSFIHI